MGAIPRGRVRPSSLWKLRDAAEEIRLSLSRLSFMSDSKQRHKRKTRHRANNKLKNSASVREHAKLAGRTGAIHEKKTKSTKAWPGRWLIPNRAIWWWTQLTQDMP